jgi:uncharacterized 2Fe-2S/4Fe-4S cluster protein (DUF4445 family)
MLKKCRIQVEGFGEIASDPGHLYLEVLNRAGLDLHNDCGGHGKCGKCRIVFFTPPPEEFPSDKFFLKDAERARGMRLACFHQIRGDCRIEIPAPAQTELLDDLPRG